MKKEELYWYYATNSDLKTYHYKVLFLLMNHELTQSQICSILDISKQNLNKICKDLLSIEFIIYSKIVGKNKYLKINTNAVVQLKGQLTLEDV